MIENDHENSYILSNKKLEIKTEKTNLNMEEDFCMSFDKLKLKYLLDDNIFETGLFDEQVLYHREKYGRNTFSQGKKTNNYVKFLSIYIQPFNLLLFVACKLSFVVYFLDRNDITNLYLGIGILAVSIFNTFLEFYQEYKTAAILEGFKNLVPNKCAVIRNGCLKMINIEDIVVCDIIYIQMGDKVGADLRLFSASSLKVDNSSLTGESEPIKKGLNIKQKDYTRAENMLLSGDMVITGEGKGIVLNTGDNTTLGRIARLTMDKTPEKSELSEEINTYVRKLGLFALITSIIFYGIAMFNGFILRDNLVFCIGVFIAFVPQGLPAAVTILMTIAARRMAKRNILVKDLRAVETLGAISLLASDKTGTLTQGKMTCTNFWNGIRSISIISKIDDFENNTNLRKSVKICYSTSNVKKNKDGCIFGDPTETALYNFGYLFMKNNNQLIANTNKMTKVHEEPFNSDKKWHVTVFKDKEQYKIYVKGAPERILGVSTNFYENNFTRKINKDFKDDFNKIYNEFASQGQRVIALAERTVSKKFIFEQIGGEETVVKEDGELNLSEMTFLGMIGIVDPPKNGVRNSIIQLRLAGIQVVMVTGDHPLTAQYIAKKIHIISGKTKEDAAIKLNKRVKDVKNDEYDAEVINGDQIDGFSEDEWERILSKKEIVFARTSPKQKLLIVEKFQEKGHIVGVSGDGVNDSPALKKAHLGISMNKTGNEVSKEAAAMILMDDDFSSIVVGVLEGRLIFSNLKKCVRYILSHITPQVIPFLLYVTLGVPSPMSTLLLMFIDLFTEFFPSIFLAWEPPEGNLMMEHPRKMLIKKSLTEENEVPRFSLLQEAVKNINNFKKSDCGETLCDFELISWSYIEAGMLITLGALGAFFLTIYNEGIPLVSLFMVSQNYFRNNALGLKLNDGRVLNSKIQMEILYKAQSAYFISILIGQGFNILACKRKNEGISKNTFKNLWPLFGTIFGLSFGYFVLNVSYCRDFLYSRHVSFAAITFPIATGMVILFWDSIRKNLRKKHSFFGKKMDIDVICKLKRSRNAKPPKIK